MLRGQVRLTAGEDRWEAGTGDHLVIPPARHDLHALTDALLGAIADGDIGTHFPPSDEQWRGASSDRFLAHACKLVRERGGRIDHLDITVLAEAPRIGAHREQKRQLVVRRGLHVTAQHGQAVPLGEEPGEERRQRSARPDRRSFRGVELVVHQGA